MKKIVSLILVICILSASCVLFSSCADRTLSEKVLKENPVKQLEVLADGADKALTDFFDGFLARKFHLESDFGRLMDPLADKIMVLTAMFSLAIGNAGT